MKEARRLSGGRSGGKMGSSAEGEIKMKKKSQHMGRQIRARRALCFKGIGWISATTFKARRLEGK